MFIFDRVLFDDLGHAVRVPCYVDRIVSLCPSITETLFGLDYGAKIVGRTRYCTQPKVLVDRIDSVGGTKDVDIDKVLQLRPDLVLSVKEENDRDNVLELAKHVPVFVFDIRTFGDAMHMVLTLGKIANRTFQADNLVVRIEEEFAGLHVLNPTNTYLYLVWKKPLMLAGRNTFIDSMMSVLGLKNVIPYKMGPYPLANLEQCIQMSPDVVILPTEPYHFNEDDIHEFKQLFPNSKILGINGEMSSWYGSHMLDAANYFKSWVNLLN